MLTPPPADEDFRRLAENIPTLCWIAGPDGYITWYNRRWYEYTGTTIEQMQGWGWQSVHEPKSLAAVLERWQAAIDSAEPFEMVFPIRGADGVYRPFLTRINPAFDENGVLINWFGVNTDITPQVEAEDAFARSEAKFRVLADSMPQMVWSAAPDGHVDYYNARWYEFSGVPIGATDGDGWRSILHPEDADRAWAAWRQSLETGAPYHIEYRLRHRDGLYRWVLARSHPERDKTGAISRWYGTCTDIEEIVQARSVLKQSRDALEQAVIARTGERNLLARLVETTDVLIMAIDLNYTVLAINKANADEFLRLYGKTASVGDNLLELLADQPAAQEAVRLSFSRGLAGEELTCVVPRGDAAGPQRYFEITLRTLRNDAGEQIGTFQFAHDVTERLRDQALLQQAQQALLQSQKLEAMGQLTGGVAHDFNNLLTPIIGSLDMLQRRGIGGAREQRLIHGAYQSAERARLLVQRLLAFARRQPLQAVAIDTGALVRDAAELIGSTVGPATALALDVAEDVPPAKADPHQLEMALLNLCVNARDAMAGTGTIRLSATRAVLRAGEPPDLPAGVYARLAVKDSGKGMDEATRARAIEPFFSTKGVGKGTGLGLSMAHGLALQLGGALTIESAPGQGTEVAIWLPEAALPVPAAPPGRPAGGTGLPSAGTVLLVDDEEYVRQSTADMLTELGFEVHEAGSADAALALMQDGFAPDILITDHIMPGMTGVELAEAASASHPAMKRLIMSGYADSDGIDPALPRLTKPFVQEDLALAIAALHGPLQGLDDVTILLPAPGTGVVVVQSGT